MKADRVELGNLNTKGIFPNTKFMYFEIDSGSSAIYFKKDLYEKVLDRVML